MVRASSHTVMVVPWFALGVCLMFAVPARCLHVSGYCSFDPLFLEGTCSARSTDPAALQIQDVFLSLAEADCDLASPCHYPPHYSPRGWEEFDFIVVGAGTAGSVVANRLSEISGWTVLLLEAGGDPPKTSEVPSLRGLLRDTEVDWQFKTDSEEPNCLGSVGRQCKWPRGKMLGGCSSINGMLYVRGNPRDYDGWESEGNVGWGYNDVLPYFKKSEDMKACDVKSTPSFSLYHGTGGPLKVDSFNVKNYKTLLGLMSDGFAELGYLYNPDTNGGFQSGFCRQTGTLEDGRRCSTAKAFLSPLKNRNNFKLSKHSLVTKVLIDKIKNVAYGVEFVDGQGNIVRVLARKEVILSGGTVNSPQILLLSGVGPRQHLMEHGVEVIHDLPVGNNLHDHYYITGIMIALDYTLPEEDSRKNMFNFLLKKIEDSFSELAFTLLMDIIPGEIDYPDIQVYFSYSNQNSSALSQRLEIMGYNNEIKQRFLEVNKHSPIFFMSPNLLNVKSRGSIRLRSKNPMEYPKITGGYFSDQRDVDTLIESVKILRGLTYTEPFRALGATFYEVSISSCSRFPPDSRPYWECFLRHMVTTGGHPVGTCRMGRPGSPDAVVDPQLRVQGVDRLRVIDASVMPTVIRGNTNAPTIMIAEKGSDLIKQKWFNTSSPPRGATPTASGMRYLELDNRDLWVLERIRTIRNVNHLFKNKAFL